MNTFGSLLTLCGSLLCQATADADATAWDRVEQAALRQDSVALRSALEELAASDHPSAAPNELARMQTLIGDSSLAPLDRKAIFDVTFALSRGASIAESVRSLDAALAASQTPEQTAGHLWMSRYVLRAFAREEAAEFIAHDNAAEAFAFRIIKGGRTDSTALADAWNALGALEVDDSAILDAAYIEATVAPLREMRYPLALAALDRANSDSRERFRELLRRSEPTLPGFNYCAATALSHVGDEPTVGILESVRSAPDARRSEHFRKFEHVVESLEKQITIQRSDDQMLKLLATGPADPRDINFYTWVFRRCVERGVSNASLRGAVLQHADAVTTAIGPRALGVRRQETLVLAELAWLAAEAGALNEEDLRSLRDAYASTRRE